MRSVVVLTALLLITGCDGPAPVDSAGESGQEPAPELLSVSVSVFLDGERADDVTVMLGGSASAELSGPDGEVSLWVPQVGEQAVIGSHPDARTRAVPVPPGTTTARLELERFSRADNPSYPFANPGPPEDQATNDRCGHCHVTIAEDWASSVHRSSASNTAVQAAYAVLQSRAPGESGACADCHAPGIDGQLGGRALSEAAGRALEHGVHCDVCHKVEHVDLAAPAGVAGRLGILRPSEPSTSGVDSYAWVPLAFGPYGDVPNPRMGAVGRPHFTDGTLCAGCHELWQAPLLPGETSSWAEGVPVHTTFSEWREGPYGDSAPCNTCHMPPDPSVGNSGDLGNLVNAEGVAGGWYRPPGAVKHHTWDGPRSADGRLIRLAAAVDLELEAAADAVSVSATVSNVGAGHYLPTGEPLRQVVLHVAATCDGAPLMPIGGQVIPDEGGVLAEGSVGLEWPGAEVGEQLVVLERQGFRDYDGWGPFGVGARSAGEKGLPSDEVVAVRTIVAVDGSTVSLDGPLPDGDRVLRLPAPSWPVDGAAPRPVGGRPGQLFSRVLAASSGEQGVLHAEAVDVVRDNRLAPLGSSRSVHRFAPCEGDVEARAVLTHRSMPASVSEQLSHTAVERVMVEVTR